MPPIPLLPIKQRSSTGFMLSAGRPCLESQALIRALPYLSGNTSANKPGRPLNVLVPLNSGKENTRLSAPAIGIFNGDRSHPFVRKDGSYSNEANSVSTSQAIAPTLLFQILMNAVVIITSHF